LAERFCRCCAGSIRPDPAPFEIEPIPIFVCPPPPPPSPAEVVPCHGDAKHVRRRSGRVIHSQVPNVCSPAAVVGEVVSQRRHQGFWRWAQPPVVEPGFGGGGWCTIHRGVWFCVPLLTGPGVRIALRGVWYGAGAGLGSRRTVRRVCVLAPGSGLSFPPPGHCMCGMALAPACDSGGHTPLPTHNKGHPAPVGTHGRPPWAAQRPAYCFRCDFSPCPQGLELDSEPRMLCHWVSDLPDLQTGQQCLSDFIGVYLG